MSFPLRTSGWTWLFVRPLAWGPLVAEVRETEVAIRMGWIGGGEVPLEQIDRVGRMPWPWWGGIGARLGRGLVAFVASSGPCAVLELAEPVKVRAPLGWSSARIVIGVDEVEAFVDAVAEAKRALRAARRDAG